MRWRWPKLAALWRLPPGAPVVVLVHGFRFSPDAARFSPHDHIFALTPRRGCRRAVSWPRHLGFGHGQADEGLCIAFGWPARGSIWSAWHSAETAGRALADLVARIAGLRPGPVDMVTHSLGARVGLAALARAPGGSVGRMVLMAAAEFGTAAAAAMGSVAGRRAEVINITTRENDLFDAAVERLIRPPVAGDRVLGGGMDLPGWLDVQIDGAATRRALDRMGFRVPAPRRRICHWSGYLRPGLFGFYGAVLREREVLTLDVLRRTLPPENHPRWDRLLPPLPGIPRKKSGRIIDNDPAPPPAGRAA